MAYVRETLFIRIIKKKIFYVKLGNAIFSIISSTSVSLMVDISNKL